MFKKRLCRKSWDFNDLFPQLVHRISEPSRVYDTSTHPNRNHTRYSHPTRGKYVHSRRVSVSLPQGFPTQKNYQRHVPWSRVVEVILQPVYLIHLIHQHPSHVLNGWGWDEWMGWLLWVGWNLRIFTLWMRSISRNKKRIQVELVDWYLFTTAWLYLIGIN